MPDVELSGLGAAPGVAEGAICFSPVETVTRSSAGESIILVREMTVPADTPAIEAATGVLTSEGGQTSHAAIVAREFDTPAVVGCQALSIDTDAGRLSVEDRTVEAGDRVRIDGTAGTVSFPE